MNATVNTAAFTAMCEQLAGLSAAKLRDVLNAEVTSVLNKTITNTKIAKVGRIKARHDNAEYSQQRPTIYTPQTAAGLRHRSRVKLSKNGSIKYKLDHRYPAALWGAIVASRKARLARQLAAVGLARKSWWSIGKALNLAVKGGRFTGAIATTGREYPENIATNRSASEQKIGISFSNSQPTVQLPQVGGARALQRAIDGRVKFFHTNAEKAVFADVAKVAKAYPGIVVHARN